MRQVMSRLTAFIPTFASFAFLDIGIQVHGGVRLHPEETTFMREKRG
jgi:hypothetical protein